MLRCLVALGLAFASVTADIPAQTNSLAVWYARNFTLVTSPTPPDIFEFSAIDRQTSAFIFSGLTPAGSYSSWTNWSTTDSPDTGKYLEYRLAASPGYRLSLSALTFGAASTSGNLTLTARTSADNFSTVVATLPVISDQNKVAWDIPLGSATVPAGTPYTVRIYGVASSSSTRLVNMTPGIDNTSAGIFSAAFLGSFADIRPPSLETSGKTFSSTAPSFLLKGTSTKTTAIQWSLNGTNIPRTLPVNGRTWQLRVAPLRPGKNTLSLVAINTATGQKSRPYKVTILR